MSRIRVATIVDGAHRGLFSIQEKPNGELLVPVPTGARHGNIEDLANLEYETAPTVLERRISIHESPNSEKYTTIKRTTVLSNGKHITAVALTDAVKTKNGFGSVFVLRSENMSGEGYAPLGNVKVGDRLLSTPEYDPKIYTLFTGLYIGHPDVAFEVRGIDPMILIEPIRFRKFQLVVMFYIMELRSHYSGEMGSQVTFNPTSVPIEDRPLYDELMRGKSAPDCVRLFQNGVWSLARRVLDVELREAKTPAAISYFKTRLDRIPKKTTIAVERDTELPPTHILFDE